MVIGNSMSDNALEQATRAALGAIGLDDGDLNEEFCSQPEQDFSGCLQSLEEQGIEDLHNKGEPNIGIQRERFWHRQAAFYTAQGMSQREICKHLNKSEGWMSQVVRQPWFSKMVLTELHRSGRDAVDEIFKNAAPASALKLIELRDSTKVPASVALSAADKILDRYMGKPKETLRHEEAISSDPHEEAKRLQAEIDELEKR